MLVCVRATGNSRYFELFTVSIMFSRKPNCSYNCLIGMALKSSDTGKLPVGEIYRFFEREFPYFLTATEPWKNSLRHSLSLGHFFRKYNIDKMQTKKGHLWEVEPHKAPELDKEMSMFLAKGIPDNLPSTSQLSILRLQMTQLYLDSIKNTPSSSYSSSLISPQRSSYCQRNTEFPAMSNLSGTMMLSPDSVSLQNFVPGQTNVNDSSPTFTIPSYHASCYSHDRPKITRSMLSSLRNRNATFSYTPPQSSSANQERDALVSETAFLSKQQFVASPLLPHVSEEAMQLIQFCNHCSFGPTHTSALQNEPGLSSSDQCTSGQNFSCIAQSNICSCTNTFHDAEDEDNRHYPFITKPTGDLNLSLSQLNSGSLYIEPGPPRELVIKKYPRGRRMKSSLSRSCKSLDNAIRPVVYDWNAWWEKEYIQCALSDEALINSTECPCDDSNNSFSEKGPQRSKNNTRTQVSNRKKSNPSFLTPTKDGNWISHLPSIQSKECREGETSSKTPSKKEGSKGKGEADKRYRDQRGVSPKVTTPPNSPVNHRDKMMSTRKKVVRVCASLRLIVSIPFRKLITERQLKKYCGEGGKYRIGTP